MHWSTSGGRTSPRSGAGVHRIIRTGRFCWSAASTLSGSLKGWSLDRMEGRIWGFWPVRRWPGVDIGVPPIDHLRWKIGPAVDGKRYHIIADAGGQIVACGLVRPCRVKLGDRIVPAVLYGDMAVLQAYQNRGIM